MSVENYIQFIVWPCRNRDILDFTHNAMFIMVTLWSHHYVRHSQKSIYDRHQNREYASILSNLILIYRLNLHKWRPSYILRRYWQLLNYGFGWWELILGLSFKENNESAIWEKSQQCSVYRISEPITISSMPENPIVDSKNDKSSSMLPKMTFIHCLTLYKWQPSWILPTMQCAKYFLTTPLCRECPKTLY